MQALLRARGRLGQRRSSNAARSVLDTRAQAVTLNGAPIELTTFEYRILEHMMLRAGDVISKTELTERLYDQDFERDSNVIEVFIGRLRRKLDPDETLQPDRNPARTRLPLRDRSRSAGRAEPRRKQLRGVTSIAQAPAHAVGVRRARACSSGSRCSCSTCCSAHAAERSLREVLDAQMVALDRGRRIPTAPNR